MPRMADCHPKERHYGRGFCRSCYFEDYAQRRGQRGQRRNSQMGLTDLGNPEHSLPFRPRPRACPRCGNLVLRSHPSRPEVSCQCGWEELCVPEAGIEAMKDYVRPPHRDLTNVLLSGGV